MTTIKPMFIGFITSVVLGVFACRRVDSSSATIGTKPSELFSTDAKKRCLERAGQLSLSSSQQAALCDGASSSAPVDCFKRKSQQGGSPDSIIGACRGVK